MKLEMRQKLAREPYEEKIREVGQLIRLARSLPLPRSPANSSRPIRQMKNTEDVRKNAAKKALKRGIVEMSKESIEKGAEVYPLGINQIAQ